MTTPQPHPTDRRTDREDARRAPDPDGSDITREFWGGSGDWSHETPRSVEHSVEHRGLAATVSRWWNSTGSIPATRVHGRPTTEIPIQRATDDLTIADLARSVEDDTDELDLDDWLVDAWSHEAPDGEHTVPGDDATAWDDDAWNDDDEWSNDAWDAPPPAAPRPMIDPLLARIGGVTVLLTLLVPAVLGFVGDSDDGDTLRTISEPSTAQPALTSTDAASTGDTGGGAPENAAPTAGDAPPSEPATTAAPSATTEATAAATAANSDGTEPVAEQLTVDSCGSEYEVVAGDFWIRIADASGAALADLLAANSATIATPLYPGSTICLPAGATTPAPPSVGTSNSSGQNSTTTSPAPSPPPATAAPTTPAPTTTSPPLPPGSNATAAEVQAIIRAVWPDELEERALEIAWRESNFDPTAKNFCCYGVFQIYWSVHKSWLSGMGITAAEQLYDPTTNARAALALYQRAGGWGPWGG